MKVFADYHHDDLFNSLQMLFEGRLGGQLYRPIGTNWWSEGWWKVYDHPATAEQYLGLHIGESFEKLRAEQPQGCHRWLNEGYTPTAVPGMYCVPNPNYPERPTFGVTLDQFKDVKFDIIVSSMPYHFGSFERLRQQYQPQAKHIFQMGNMWAPPAGCMNLLNSTTSAHHGVPNAVRYHQEFDTKLFCPEPSGGHKRVCSLLHLNDYHGRKEFLKLEKLMPDFQYFEYGAGNRDGGINPGMVAPKIRDSGLIMHVKVGGDGYGYNIHHAAACGKPVIYRGRHVRGQIAESLLIHGETAIDLDRAQDPADMIRTAYRDRWGEKTYERFKAVCDFDRDFEAIQTFMSRLV